MFFFVSSGFPGALEKVRDAIVVVTFITLIRMLRASMVNQVWSDTKDTVNARRAHACTAPTNSGLTGCLKTGRVRLDRWVSRVGSVEASSKPSFPNAQLHMYT